MIAPAEPKSACDGEPVAARWTRVLSLTESMREHALAAEWEHVAELELLRQPLLLSVMDQPVDSSAAGVIAENIQNILQTDAEIRRLGQTRLDELQSHLLQIRSKKKASLVYAGSGG